MSNNFIDFDNLFLFLLLFLTPPGDFESVVSFLLFGILAILAMSITIHFLGLILLHFTLMVSVEFQRNTEYVDQVIEEQSQLLTQSSALYLVYLACEYKELTFEHVMKSGKQIQAQIKRRSEHREWSTVVDIFIASPSFKLVALPLPRISSISKTAKQVLFFLTL